MTAGADLLRLGIEPVKTRKAATLGEAGYERKERDFYPTEPWVTEALCQAVEFDNRGILWEPACGDGRMAKVLDRWHAAVVSSDIADYGYGETGIDFLDPSSLAWLQNVRANKLAAIVTNPPFDLARQFIVKALELTKESHGKVAMLQRHEFDAPRTNHELFRITGGTKLILHKRPRWSEDDKASPRFPYAWYVWDWCEAGGMWTTTWCPDPGQSLPSEGRLL